MIRVLSFLVVLVLASAGPYWLFILGALGYGLYYSGLELIVLACLMDAFFMNSHMLIPAYTLGAVGLLCLAELVKPYTVLYNQN